MAESDLPVSVVVTVLNDRCGLAVLLDALQRQSRRPDEIVVVDGGSTDGTIGLLEHATAADPTIRYLVAEGANIATGRNRAILHTRSTIIACTDVGCVPEPDWLAELVRPFADPSVDVVGGAYRIDPHSRLERVVGLLTMPGQLTPVEPATFNPSARSVAFRVSAWRAAGGFPEWLYTAEDTLFDCKLRRLGMGFAFASRAIVRWRPRVGVLATARQFRNYSRGEAHIGRGRGAACFWIKRYATTLAVVVAASAAAVIIGRPEALEAGVLAAGMLLVAPWHARARQVAEHTGRKLDYPATIICGHWVALASAYGWILGRRDRRRRPDVYSSALRVYWGDDVVGDVTPWRTAGPSPPRTLIVSWHWPPTNRASAAVLGNLFCSADPEHFRVLTRGLVVPPPDDRTPEPPLDTWRVKWPLAHDETVPGWSWMASIMTVIRLVVAANRLHRGWHVQRLLAVHPHRYGLLAGYLIARATGVPLVVYMHDLLAETLVSSSKVKRWFWQWVDRWVVSSAWMVVVPTQEFAEHYRRRGITRTWVLPHCRPSGISASPPPSFPERIRLLYSGRVYQAQADSVRVLEAAVAGRLDVELMLDADLAPGSGGGQAVWRPRAVAQQRLHEADVLVVALGRDTPYPEEIQGCFPSKLAEYLAVGRPILAIVPAGCFVDRLVRQSRCGISVTSYDPAEVGLAIDRLQRPGNRRRMIEAAGRLSRQLAAERWMRLLGKRLAGGPLPDPATPEFPDLAALGTAVSLRCGANRPTPKSLPAQTPAQ